MPQPLQTNPGPEPGTIAVKLWRITGLDVKIGPSGGLPYPWRAEAELPEGGYLCALSITLDGLRADFLLLNLQRCRNLLLARDPRCGVCTSPRNLEMDHIEPRSHGRNDRLENLQLLCHDCHRRKTGEPQWIRREITTS